MADSVALTALLVSLVALLATTGQLLQQYFATADGYRRCQPSVMGLWARKTKLRWRWREFRFETIFSVPRIIYGPIHSQMGMPGEVEAGSCSLIDTSVTLKGSMTYPGWMSSYDARKYYSSDELACWVPLLAQYVKLRNIFPSRSITVADADLAQIAQPGKRCCQTFPSETRIYRK